MQRNFIDGSEFLLYDIDGNAVALSKNCTLSLKQNLISVTSKDSLGWAESIAGSRGWTLSFEGLVSYDQEFDTQYFLNKMNSKEPFFIKLGVVQANFDYSYWGEVSIENIEITANYGDVVSYEGSLKGVGELQYTNVGSPEQSGYLKVETDPIFTRSPAFDITNQNKTNWTDAFNKTLQSIEASTANNTTTLVATLRDGSKYSTAWLNSAISGGTGTITSLNFNTSTGNLTVNNLSTSLDGRYQTIGDYVSNSFLTSNFYNKIEADSKYYGVGNPAGYITSYSEIDTLASVTARGNNTIHDIITSGSIEGNKGKFTQILSIPSTAPNVSLAGEAYLYFGLPSNDGEPASGGSAVNLSELLDVNLNSPSNGQSLVYNGSKWINQAVVTSTDLSNYYTKVQDDSRFVQPSQLGSNAYTSTAYMPYSGGTFTGTVDMNSQRFRYNINNYIEAHNADNDGTNFNSDSNIRHHYHWGMQIETYSGEVTGAFDSRAGNWITKGSYYIKRGTGNYPVLDVFNNPVSTSATNYTLVQRNNAGQIFASYFNTTATIEGFTPDAIFATNGVDGYLRRINIQSLQLGLGLGSFAYRNQINGNEVVTQIENSGIDLVMSRFLRWQNYGSGHVIFDASQGIAPDGSSHSNVEPENGWAPTFPTLMGWNGNQTYGVRVDASRVAQNALGWFGQTYATNDVAVNTYMMGYGADGQWHPTSVGNIRNFLGLGSLAYLNNGDTLSSSITGNANSATIWGGRSADLSGFQMPTTGLLSVGSDNVIRQSRVVDIQSWLGLGTGAYNDKTKLWSVSHPNDYYISNSWDGTYWQLTSNHSSPVNVGHSSDSALLSGYGLAISASPNTVVARDTSGHIFANYFNSSRAEEATVATSYIYDSGDGYMRKKSVYNSSYELVDNQNRHHSFTNSSTGTAYNNGTLELINGTTRPSLGLHWAGVVASTISIESSGRIAIMNNPGTSYENLIALNINATNAITAPIVRATQNLAIPSAPPVNPEAGVAYLYFGLPSY